jgi:putative membrane protein
MSEMSRYAVAAVGGLHLLYMIVEICFWKPLVPRLGIYDRERAVATAPMGANMGIYNGILGTIMIWLAWNAPGVGAEPFRAFGTCLLTGVIVAGLFGGATIKWSIPIFQSLPALVALALLRASG